MSFVNGPVFTRAGKALHARAVAGATLTFTKMQLGDGDRGSAAIENLTELISPVVSVGISNLRHSGNFASVSCIFSNADLSAGFNWSEIGLFAADPDDPDDRSKDILYCYQDAAENPDYIPASDSALITKRISIAAITDNAANVSAVIGETEKAEDVTFNNEGTELESENVQAAIEELILKMKTACNAIANDHIANKSNPHGVTAAQVGADASGTAANEVNSHNSSPAAHNDIRAAVTTAQNTANAAQTAADSKATTKTFSPLSIPTSWLTNSAGGYYRYINVQGILASDNPIVDIILGSDADANAAYLEAWALVTRVVTENNKITLYADGNAPSVSFSFQAKVVR